jgi:tetratricopeptide (TPR) repeat protein
MNDPRPQSTAPVAALERRLRWRAMSLFVFFCLLAGLAVVAIVSTFTPPVLVMGLPDDPDVKAAARLTRGRIALDAGELRFTPSLLGEGGRASRGEQDSRVARAEVLVERARQRWPHDPRVAAVAATLDLVRGRLELAERGYRRAIDRSPSYGEARMGLGVTLALSAREATDERRARGLELQAIAQFAAVPERDPHHEAALYDRALLLAKVGRREEAHRLARAYLTLDSTSRWASILSRATGVR